MSKERKAKQIVLYVQLEDNVGAVIAKRKVEIPVEPEIDFEQAIQDITKSFL